MESTTTAPLPLYSTRAILIFSLLFSAVAGGALLAQNMRDLGRPAAAWTTLGGSIAYTVLALYLMACGDSRGFAMGLLGGLGPFACFAWQVPDRNAFPAKSIRKPLTICLLISALLLLMLLRLLSGLYMPS